jgi:DNA-binding NarL/FixJ family response regulator
MTAVYNSHYERVISAVCAELGKAAFLQAKAEGHHLTPVQAFSPEEQEEPLQSLALPVNSPLAAALVAPESPDQASNKYFKPLTPREIAVLKLIAMGLSNGEVAKQLSLSPRTVNVHLTSIYIKLRVKSRTAASRYALKHKLIE